MEWPVVGCQTYFGTLPMVGEFQPTFEKLSTAAIWIQIYHLPMEPWGGEILEIMASQFGSVLKIDEDTFDCSRAKFARVCVDLDLEQPLQQGTWVKYGGFSVLILVLYEKLPVFCFRLGRVGHGKANYSFTGSHLLSGLHVSSFLVETKQVQDETEMQVNGIDKG